MDELIEKLLKLPPAAKVGIAALIVVVVTGLAYYVWPDITTVYRDTENAERQLAQLEQELIKKQAIANDLNLYRREMEVLEQRLEEALAEMPEEVNMDALLNQLAELARKAGLELTTITPQGEVSEGGFYARVPIRMQVTGSYNEIAVFLDSVGRLKRIINVNNIGLTQPKSESDEIVLNAEYLATTYRFAGNGQAEAQQPGAKPKRGGRR